MDLINFVVLCCYMYGICSSLWVDAPHPSHITYNKTVFTAVFNSV